MLNVMDERLGLREWKKRESRRRIADVASGLFIERGFDNVTIAEVAEAANVARMTVFNYFPRKEDLFLDRHADLVDDLRRAIRDRESGESVVAAVRRYLHELLATQHSLSGAREGNWAPTGRGQAGVFPVRAGRPRSRRLVHWGRNAAVSTRLKE